MQKYIYLLPFLIHAFLSADAQSSLPALDSYFAEVRTGRSPRVPLEIVTHKPSKETLEALVVYYNDTSALLRLKANSIAHDIATQSAELDVRQQVVLQLVSFCRDQNAGNVGMALSYLSYYKKSDFNTAMYYDLLAMLNSDTPHLDQLFKLIGFLELTNAIELIRPYTQPGNSRQNRWSAIVSLARMNDPTAVQEMMDRVRKLSVNDDIVEEIFPDLVYSRQKVAFDYLAEVLRSDAKNCTSSGENTIAIPCGYRIMEQLAKVVKDYPLQLDDSGDIKTKDYKQALATVRAWFNMHKDYEIDRDNF